MSNTEDIYSAPHADLSVKEQLPETFTHGHLSESWLQRMGWLCVFYILLSFPVLAVDFMMGAGEIDDRYQIVSTVLNVISIMIWIYLMFGFKRLLHYRLNTRAADVYIHTLILIAIPYTLFALLADIDFSTLEPPTVVYFTFSVVSGLVGILFGSKLLRIAMHFRYMKLFAWSTILMSVCLVTIMLMLLAIPLGLITDIALALMFFTAARELKTQTVVE